VTRDAAFLFCLKGNSMTPMISMHHEGAPLFAYDSQKPTKQAVLAIHAGLANHLSALRLVESIAADFRILARDLSAWLDHAGLERAAVFGTSMGSGVALRFAFDFPERCAALVLVSPVYLGAAHALTAAQRDAFANMHAFAEGAVHRDIEELLPIYDALPPPLRDRARAMASEFDPASVAATVGFLKSEVQPFDSLEDLRQITRPSLIVPGGDPQHPAHVADEYARVLPGARITSASGVKSPLEFSGRPVLDASRFRAEVAEWQTQRIQNPPSLRVCGFKSHLRYKANRAGCAESRSAQKPSAVTTAPSWDAAPSAPVVEPSAFGAPQPVAGLEGVGSVARFSQDEKTVFVSFNVDDAGVGHLVQASRSGIGASFGAFAPFTELYVGTSETHPSISADDRTIYFTIFPGLDGGPTDIYYAQRSGPDASFGAYAAVPGIDTIWDDEEPYITANGELWFASNRDDDGGDPQLYRARSTPSATASEPVGFRPTDAASTSPAERCRIRSRS
jgi:pimeloyl-ACP methyl ester carboxylesterase